MFLDTFSPIIPPIMPPTTEAPIRRYNICLFSIAAENSINSHVAQIIASIIPTISQSLYNLQRRRTCDHLADF
jgi:hypothetical protein